MAWASGPAHSAAMMAPSVTLWAPNGAASRPTSREAGGR
ncbi:Uncharacterised protein [Bordetella pertussis]|nr:Uncharacterised protein [Bordetella pertussis]